MRQSRAEIFRNDLRKEDITKEPLTVFFSSMIAFGNQKNEKKNQNMVNYEQAPVQSQVNIIQNLMLYKFEANKKEDSKEQMKLEDFPKLSEIVQDEQHGFLADISAAIKNNESPEDPEAKLASCLLPSTTFEFEKSEKVQQISAIRGLTPGKDLQIQLSDTLTSLLVSKITLDARFKAID